MVSEYQRKVKKNKAKIGVLTFSFTKDNYGQVLQYLATQEYLGRKGLEATLVEPKGWSVSFKQRCKNKLREILYRIKNRIIKPKRSAVSISVQPQIEKKEEVKKELGIEEKKAEVFNRWTEITERKETEQPRMFEEFKKKYFSRQAGTYNEILGSGYKAYCIGSDQTWSCAGWHMMLGWVPPKYKRFTIAPSIGHRHYSDEEVNSFRNELCKFDFITVREDNGLELCHRCGYEGAVKVLDPTFLLPSSAYEPFVDVQQETQKPYVFIYLLGADIEVSIDEMVKFCKSQGYDVKYVESQGRDENVESIPATVGQWLGLIKNASYVLTNSFHGMAFSIIYHKPFVVFPIIGLMKDMNSRILNLAASLNLMDRIYNGNLNVLHNSIDWNVTERVINENRKILDHKIENLNL